MLTDTIVATLVAAALAEDAPWGDITSESFIPLHATAVAHLVAREPGVYSGRALFSEAFVQCDSQVEVDFQIEDGDRFVAGDRLATVKGNARALLRAERIGLNFTQRMSGIASLTAEFVAAVADTNARIVDTRKTTPGLRAIERHAVRCGGGVNHRFSLSDAVMAKDNHLAIMTAQGLSLTESIQKVRKTLGHTTHVEVEVDSVDQIEAVLAGGVDTIMLDNFSISNLRKGVQIVAGRAIVEASGGVNIDTVAEIASTGVDVISVGALTHSVRSLDLGLDVHMLGVG